MATPDEVAELRFKTGLAPNDNTYGDDDALGALIDEKGSVNAAASEIWQMKAASYSTLVNVSESGSSRSMGDLYKNALGMAQYYGGSAATGALGKTATTRSVVREGGF